jgi:hypothetical protein
MQIIHSFVLSDFTKKNVISWNFFENLYRIFNVTDGEMDRYDFHKRRSVFYELKNAPYSLTCHREMFRTKYVDVGFEVFTAVVMKSTAFWDIMPCSPLSVNRRIGWTYRLHLQGRKNKFSEKPASKQVAILLVTCLLAELISSTLKMEAICSSDTSVDTQRTKRRYIPEDGILKNM